MDLNGNESHMLYKFLKRFSPLFLPKYGKSNRIKEHYSKFLCDRYGVVKHYYSPNVEYAVIEADIKQLLQDSFNEHRFQKLLNPPDNLL